MEPTTCPVEEFRLKDLSELIKKMSKKEISELLRQRQRVLSKLLT